MAAANLSTTEKLAVLETDTTVRSFAYTGHGGGDRLRVENIGVNAIAMSYSSSIANTSPASAPVQAADEYILPAGSAVVLPSGVFLFYHVAETGRVSQLSVVVLD